MVMLDPVLHLPSEQQKVLRSQFQLNFTLYYHVTEVKTNHIMLSQQMKFIFSHVLNCSATYSLINSNYIVIIFFLFTIE